MRLQQMCAFFVVFCIVVEGNNQAIQCYVCDDCDILNDCLLESCPPDAPATPTAASTISTTPPIPTPMPTPTSNLPPTATSSLNPTSGTSTSQRPPTSTPDTTEPPNYTTTVPTTDTEQTDSTSTSETDETSDSTTSTPVTDPPSTAPTSTSTSTSAQTPTSTLSPLNRNLTRGSVSYHCYSIDVVENYKQKTKRGCVAVPEEDSACAVLREEYGCSSKNCKVCSTDGCNCNAALRGSLVAVIAITLCGIFSKTI